MSPLTRHFHAAAHLLCLPSLLAQRLRRDATIWRQNVLSGGAWTWATWELDAGRAREGCGEDGGYVGCHLVTEPGSFDQFAVSQTLRRQDLQQREGLFTRQPSEEKGEQSHIRLPKGQGLEIFMG